MNCKPDTVIVQYGSSPTSPVSSFLFVLDYSYSPTMNHMPVRESCHAPSLLIC